MDFKHALDILVVNIMSMVSSLIDKAPFDKTYTGVVRKIEGSKITVRINGTEKVIKSNISCSLGDYLIILIPRNNWDLAMIMGKSDGIILN